ncbi:MAG: AAA family ATPase, partial [Methanosphaera sp. rholeuAM74]
MHKLTNKLIIYRNYAENTILIQLSKVFRQYTEGNYDKEELTEEIYKVINQLLVLSTEYGFNKNLWHNYIAYILATTENPFTLISEKNDKITGSVEELVKHDYKIFKQLFDYDFTKIEEDLNINCFTIITNYTAVLKKEQIYNNEVSRKVRKLSEKIEQTQTQEQLYDIITKFYTDYGVGKLGLNRAFKISSEEEELLTPITALDDVTLDDLVGYQVQKEKLIANTESFIKGKTANNVLLYGDAGTGKSTSIKAILNQYYDKGLRMIEVYKHQTKYLSEVVEEIKNRNYKFIIYMDDLSFEETESEYKYLKAWIEGGIATNPDNILIYATSNRRHLIRENWNERSDTSSKEDMYHSDTVREKLSLVDRFGITIGYYKPHMKEYFQIVVKLAQKHPEITLTEEELISQAKQWIVSHGAPSGRTAQQLI